MKSPLLVCLLATSAMAVTPAFAASTMASTPAPAVKNMAANPAPAAPSTAASTASSAGSPAATPALGTNIAMLQVKQNGKFGKYLADGNGRALYAFTADSAAKDDAVAKSACTGACAVVWPPATIKNMPTAGKNIESSELKTIARADGIKQLTYDGQPLYLFSHDKNGAAPKGQGIQHFGGTWHLVTPGGALDQKGIG